MAHLFPNLLTTRRFSTRQKSRARCEWISLKYGNQNSSERLSFRAFFCLRTRTRDQINTMTCRHSKCQWFGLSSPVCATVRSCVQYNARRCVQCLNFVPTEGHRQAVYDETRTRTLPHADFQHCAFIWTCKIEY